jgi:N-methylhydantoinase B
MSVKTEDKRTDPITTAVIHNGLVAAAKEMSTTLERGSYNPLLFELKDYSAIITDAGGRLWAEAPGLIAFITPLPALIRHGAFKFQGRLEPGDVIIANDPFTTGTHISDTSVYQPIFVEGELVAFAATTAHWADIGGKTPGGWCPDSIDVFQEGLRLPHVKLYRAGVPDTVLHELIFANVRLPDTVRGDLLAQVAACRTGEQRVQALCNRYGPGSVGRAMEQVCAESERALRTKINALSDGQYKVEKWLDHDGVELDLRRPVRLNVMIEGDRIVADLTGSSERAAGPINIPLQGVRGYASAALKSVLAPLDTANHGELSVVEVIAPEDTVVNPGPTAPCDSYGYVGQVVIDAMLEALVNVAPERCPAGSGNVFGCFLYRIDDRFGPRFVMIDATTVGWGGRPHGDGPNLIFYGDGDTPNVPGEVIETRYPVRMRRHELNPTVIGHGQFRGGPGVIREFEILGDGIYAQSAIEGRLSPPAGIGDGLSGRPSRTIVWAGSSREQVFDTRFSFVGPVNRGECVRTESSGGGGWGPPAQRDPLRVRDDVRNELVTAEDARTIYRVVVQSLGDDWILDEGRTAALRADLELLRQINDDERAR